MVLACTHVHNSCIAYRNKYGSGLIYYLHCRNMCHVLLDYTNSEAKTFYSLITINTNCMDCCKLGVYVTGPMKRALNAEIVNSQNMREVLTAWIFN